MFTKGTLPANLNKQQESKATLCFCCNSEVVGGILFKLKDGIITVHEIIFSYIIISGFNYSPKNIDCLLVFLGGSKLI